MSGSVKDSVVSGELCDCGSIEVFRNGMLEDEAITSMPLAKYLVH